MANKNTAFTQHPDTRKETWQIYSTNRFKQQQDFIVNKLLPTITRHSEFNDNAFQVLSVGAGDGCFDIVFLDELLKFVVECTKPVTIVYTVVEPNALTLEQFKGKVQQQNKHFSRLVDFCWVNQTFQEFITGRRSRENNEKYDLVQFISSMYYMDEDVAIEETAKMLHHSGQIVVAVGVDGDVWSEMFKKFKSKITSLVADQHYITSNEVIRAAKKSDFKWEVLEAPADVDVTEMWSEGNAIGQAMLQFFLNFEEDPRKTLCDEVIEEFMTFLKGHRYNVIVNGEERFFIKETLAYVILRKESSCFD